LLAAALASAASFGLALRRLPSDAWLPAASEAPIPEWAEPVNIPAEGWKVFRSASGAAVTGAGSLAARFRLAGTFFAFGGAENTRKAVIEKTGSAAGHHIVSEGDAIDGVTVARIFHDSVILREGATEDQLWLSFSRPADAAAAGAEGVVAPVRVEALGETDRFGGKRIGENRWAFKRQSVLDYYGQLRDEPERLVQVFDSMKPLYDENRRITGYQLGIEGEADFFTAVGLREGDIVRSVNSMQMTSRRRAEYFIKEFVANRANAFILDVERDGQQQQLMYEVR